VVAALTLASFGVYVGRFLRFNSWDALVRPRRLAHVDADGEAMANMLATFAQFERRLISQRTREALAVKRASGVRLRRPPTMPESAVRRIQRQPARGESLRKIAEGRGTDRVGR
jgi:hypothetical protein